MYLCTDWVLSKLKKVAKAVRRVLLQHLHVNRDFMYFNIANFWYFRMGTPNVKLCTEWWWLCLWPLRVDHRPLTHPCICDACCGTSSKFYTIRRRSSWSVFRYCNAPALSVSGDHGWDAVYFCLCLQEMKWPPAGCRGHKLSRGLNCGLRQTHFPIYSCAPREGLDFMVSSGILIVPP